MTLQRILNRTGHFISDNASVILTSVAVGGVVTSTMMAIKATPGAMQKIWEAESDMTRKATNVEKFRLVWRDYVPTALLVTGTIACIVGAHSVNRSRQLALASAYTLTETAFTEYKEQAQKVLGQSKSQEVYDNLAKEKLEKTPISSSEVIITGGGDQLCFDMLTARYFKCDIEKIRRAENVINHEIIHNMYASQNDFYREIGLPPIPHGDEEGWNNDRLLKIYFTAIVSDDGRPALCINYDHRPKRDYYKIG